ncbi:MAG: hypothetical protein RL154_342, partial [Pseudomonadota bacterium]
MKIKNSIVLCAISCFLTACGSDSSSTQTSSNTGTSDISSIYTANANYATKLAPTELLDGSQQHSQWDLYNADGTTWSDASKVSIAQTSSDTSSLCVKPANKYSKDLNITTAELETMYEDHFCQLNAKQGITLNTKQCQDNINFIKNQSDTGNFNLNAKPILNNPLGIKSVSFMPINYSTTVPLPSGDKTFNVSGGLIMPNDINKSSIKGVAVYFHGTTFNKSSVGSNWCNPETQLVAAVFASQGYIVVMPDYVGQGVDWQDVHPYVLYPKVSAKTAADMLSSVKSTIQTKYGMSDSDALKLFSFGYSEGGAYSLWFNTYLRDNPSIVSNFYSLTHSVGMEGAYNTSTVIKNFLFDNVTDKQQNTYNIQRTMLTDAVKPLLSAD